MSSPVSRSSVYEHTNTADGITSLSDKLAAEARQSIRSISSFYPMSPQWVEMASKLDKLAAISDMEEQLPKKKKNGTLWECNEFVLRYLLEDGKMNLYEGHIELDTRAIMDTFETGVGLILRNAYKHVEALQTSDVTVIMNHIGVVIIHTLKRVDGTNAVDEEDKEGRDQYLLYVFRPNCQATLVLHFLYHISSNLDHLDEEHILKVVEEQKLLSLLARYLHLYHSHLSKDTLELSVKAFSNIVAREDFKTHKHRHMNSLESRGQLLAWQNQFLDKCVENYDFKKQVRPLLDYLRDIERQMKK